MKKFSTKIIALLIVMVLIVGCLAACSSGGSSAPASTGTTSNEPAAEPEPEGPALVGKWEYAAMSDYCYIFREDGTGIYSTDNGETAFFEFEWTDNGDSVTLDYVDSDFPGTFKYTINGNILSIEDSFGDMIEYKKA